MSQDGRSQKHFQRRSPGSPGSPESSNYLVPPPMVRPNMPRKSSTDSTESNSSCSILTDNYDLNSRSMSITASSVAHSLRNNNNNHNNVNDNFSLKSKSNFAFINVGNHLNQIKKLRSNNNVSNVSDVNINGNINININNKNSKIELLKPELIGYISKFFSIKEKLIVMPFISKKFHECSMNSALIWKNCYIEICSAIIMNQEKRNSLNIWLERIGMLIVIVL